MAIPRGYLLVQKRFCHYPLLNIEPISWGLTDGCARHFLNKYTWVPWQTRKKPRLLDLSGTEPAVLCYSPRHSAPSPQSPGSHILLVIITFLENQSMLLVLLVHYVCEYSCFEIDSMNKKINSVSPTLLGSLSFCYNQEHLMRKS